MQIDHPSWKLKSPRCPCYCGGEGALVFCKCPVCSAIILECDEVGTKFPDFKNLMVTIVESRPKGSAYSTFTCPFCKVEGIKDLNLALDSDIEKAGFKPNEYE